jgi:hypothetical protein
MRPEFGKSDFLNWGKLITPDLEVDAYTSIVSGAQEIGETGSNSGSPDWVRMPNIDLMA